MTPARRAAGFAGELLMTTGALLALFLVWQLWWTDIEANAEVDRILEATEQQFAQAGSSAQDGRSGTADGDAGIGAGAGGDPSTSTGPAMAIVHLPTIDEVRPVNEGVELSVLNRGVLGHYPDTARPGEVGNFAVAGHRTTYGRPLWDIASLSRGDPIVVETPTDYYVYRLRELRIVQPDQTEVVAAVPGRPGELPTQRWMVMTACHPKFSASQRIVALSTLERNQPRSAGLPPELTGS